MSLPNSRGGYIFFTHISYLAIRDLKEHFGLADYQCYL